MPIPTLAKPLIEKDIRTPGFLDRLHGYISYAAGVSGAVHLEPWYRAILNVIAESPEKLELEQLLKSELAQMRFICLPLLLEEEVPKVFLSDIAHGIKVKTEEGSVDAWELVRRRLTTVPHWLRNDYKSRWLKDLHQNGELLTSNQIVVAGAQVSGTVQNWLKDYDLAMGTLAPAEGLKKTQYLFRGNNMLKTPEQERPFVQTLIEIYEKLKLDSLTPEGVEQSPMILGRDGRDKEIIDGVMYDIDSGLPDAEYQKGIVQTQPVPATPVKATPKPKPETQPAPIAPLTPKLKPVPTSATPSMTKSEPTPALKPKRVRKVAPPSTPPVPPTPATPTPKPTPVPKIPAAPVETARVAQTAPMTEVDMQKLPPTVVKRPSPAASSPQQTPKLNASLPTGSAKPTPGALVFSDEDEQEVANIKKAQKVFFKSPEGIDYDYVAKKVMAVHKLFFPSYDLERRFGNLVTSYMKGVRDQMEFKDLMTRPENTGGLNLSGDITEKILLTISEEAANAPMAKARAMGGATKSQLTPSMGQVKKAMAQTKATEGKVTPTGEMVQTKTQTPVVKVTRTVTPTAPKATTPTSAVRAPLDTRKPLMTDIKVPPKVMGPVDELANLSVVEFRRLGSTAQAATEKVKGKIDILEAESLLKRSEGIKAWQSSPVNQLYVQLGQDALNTGRQVEDVIQQRTLSQQPVLTKQEFDAIADLNKRLRY